MTTRPAYERTSDGNPLLLSTGHGFDEVVRHLGQAGVGEDGKRYARWPGKGTQGEADYQHS